jgi:CRISPR/Cas system CSM-associated protein Csm3 (group 7 of RAMP superfamily)
MDKNPYDFVRTDWKQEPDRKTGTLWHNKFQGISGYIKCKLTVKTPLFIPNAKVMDNNEFCFYKDKKNKFNKQYFIPGSSLKGMLRSITEAVGNGCYLLFDGDYKSGNKNRPGKITLSKKLPAKFKACNNINALCIGCRLFGMMGKSNSQIYKGNVSVSDGLLTTRTDDSIFEKFELGAMGGPGPWHTSFYCDKENKHISGRKFYYHHYHAHSASHRGVNIKIAIKKGTFAFTVHFQNMYKTDFPALLYSLVLEDTMWHKIGYGKPYGMGSVKIECTEIVITDQEKRYTDPAHATQAYTERRDLFDYINKVREGFVAHHPSPFVLEDLRKIWNNEVSADVAYTYPDLDWFDKNPGVRLEDYQKGMGR